MSSNEITFIRYGKKELAFLFFAVVFVLTLLYFVFPKGFWTGLISGAIYLLMTFLSVPLKYVITTENRLESHFIFGKMERRTIKIDKILELKIQKMNQLTIKYNKEGFSQPTWAYQRLNNQDMKHIQHELLKRNPAIMLS